MAKENKYLGVLFMIVGAGIYLKTRQVLISLIPLILGIAFIVFSNEEDKIEQRKDSLKRIKLNKKKK